MQRESLLITFTIIEPVIHINEIIFVPTGLLCLDGAPKAEKMSARCDDMIEKMVLLYLTVKMMCSELNNETKDKNIKYYLEMLGTQSDLDQTLSNLIFNSQNNVL